MPVILIIVVTGALTLWLVIITGRRLRQIMIIRGEGFSKVKYNNNLEAAELATRLVEEAQEEVEIYDDGDFFEESTYNHAPFIQAIQDKLSANPSFSVRCFFNEPSKRLPFIEMFEKDDRVKIYRRTEGDRPDDFHYKAIDGWLKGVVSAHKLGDGERSYRDFSYASLPAEALPRAQREVSGKFGQRIDQFERLYVS